MHWSGLSFQFCEYLRHLLPVRLGHTVQCSLACLRTRLYMLVEEEVFQSVPFAIRPSTPHPRSGPSVRWCFQTLEGSGQAGLVWDPP
jgi:hypothetical protein